MDEAAATQAAAATRAAARCRKAVRVPEAAQEEAEAVQRRSALRQSAPSEGGEPGGWSRMRESRWNERSKGRDAIAAAVPGSGMAAAKRECHTQGGGRAQLPGVGIGRRATARVDVRRVRLS